MVHEISIDVVEPLGEGKKPAGDSPDENQVLSPVDFEVYARWRGFVDDEVSPRPSAATHLLLAQNSFPLVFC